MLVVVLVSPITILFVFVFVVFELPKVKLAILLERLLFLPVINDSVLESLVFSLPKIELYEPYVTVFFQPDIIVIFSLVISLTSPVVKFAYPDFSLFVTPFIKENFVFPLTSLFSPVINTDSLSFAIFFSPITNDVLLEVNEFSFPITPEFSSDKTVWSYPETKTYDELLISCVSPSMVLFVPL